MDQNGSQNMSLDLRLVVEIAILEKLVRLNKRNSSSFYQLKIDKMGASDIYLCLGGPFYIKMAQASTCWFGEVYQCT